MLFPALYQKLCHLSGSLLKHHYYFFDGLSFFLVARLQGAFKTLFSKERMDNVAAPPFLYVAITSSDSSIVYYKLSQGIVKPPV